MTETGMSESGEYVRITLEDLTGGYLEELNPAIREFEIHRVLKESVADFDALHRCGKRGVPGAARTREIDGELAEGAAHYADSQLIISGQQVMQDWERPIMAEMARVAARARGDVLEIGFGMGISATMLLEEGVRSYTVIEANPEVRERAEQWRARYPGRDIRIVPGRWQDAIGALGRYDGIFFDTYPSTEQEIAEHVLDAPVYAQHFFPTAVEHLVESGVLTYFTVEIDSLSRMHQRILTEYFSRIETTLVTGFRPPADCQYYWADSMVVVAAVR
ncbi:class I SAM-dependent methyltransferase [Sciscionella sediminilitoris]|uniref:class I SAM-dependent methyltransferase n=1 Tax=Sciscionella sediminilitoris TaxID=1445613 RepID=UPI0012E2A1C6|nr:class I SAM-dependent methyltransferase [Sciscionella sp. SE31]